MRGVVPVAPKKAPCRSTKNPTNNDGYSASAQFAIRNSPVKKKKNSDWQLAEAFEAHFCEENKKQVALLE